MKKGTIIRQIFKSELSLDEWLVEESYDAYHIVLKNWGLNDNERQTMTGDQVNYKKHRDINQIEEMASLLAGKVYPGFVRLEKTAW